MIQTETLQIEFDARFYCEAYPREEESPLEVLKRSNFQHGVPTLIQYRCYELNNDGEPFNFTKWVRLTNTIKLWNFCK